MPSSRPLWGPFLSVKAFTLPQVVVSLGVLAILATVALWGVPQWRARSAGTELVAAARAASLGELGTRTFETAPAGGTAAADGPSVTSSGGSARVETLARWSEGADWGVVLTHAWDRRQACVATSVEPTPRCGPVEEMASGGSGATAPSGVTGSLVPMSRAAAETQWPTLLAGRAIPSVPANGGLVVADARALVATPWASMPVAGGSSGTDTTAGSSEQTVWVTWRQGNTVIQSGRASDTTASILVAAVADAETPVELWLVSSSGRVRADGGTGGAGGGGSGSVEPFSISTLTPVAGAPVQLDGRSVRVGTDSSRAWNWVFGTSLIPASSSVQNIVRFPRAGAYVVTLSSRLQSGQVVTQSRTVTVSSGGGAGGTATGGRPRAVLTASATFVAPNQAVSMSLAQSSTPASGGISTYRFVSGAGSAQSGVATTFTTVYRSAGSYTAMGIITDAAGVVDTARLTITVATGGAPLDGTRSSLNVLPLADRVVGGSSRAMPLVAKLVDVNGLVRGSVVPTVTVTPLNGTSATASASALGATSTSTGEATGSLTVPTLAPGVAGTWELALRTGGASGSIVRRDTVTFTGIAEAVAAPVPLVGRLALTSDVPPGSPVVVGQPIAPSLTGQLRSLDGTSNLAVAGVAVSVVFQQGNGTLSGASGVTDGTGRVVLSSLALNTVAGSYQLALSAEGYVPATTRVFDVVTALDGSRLSLLQQPALTMIRGQTNVVQPSVRLLNADGTPAQIPGVSVAALVASTTARGGTTLVGATATTNGAGVATFSSLRLNGLPGLVTLRFAANGYQAVVARSVQLNAPAPFVSLDTAWSPSLRHGQASAVTPVITLRDVQDRIVGTAGSSGGSGTGTTVSLNPQSSSGDLAFNTTSVSTTSGVARLPDFRAFASSPLSRTVSIRAAGYDSTTALLSVMFPSEGGLGSGPGTGLKWQLVSGGAPVGGVAAGTPIGPIVLQLVDAANTPVAAAGYPVWLAATAGRTLTGQDAFGRAGGASTDGTGLVTISSVRVQGASGSTGLITRGRESFEQGVGRSLGSVSLPVTLLGGEPTTATRSGASTLSASDGVALAPLTIQLRDVSGNPVPESGATVTLTATGGVTFAIGTATATTDATGLATIAAAIPQGLTGTVSLSATILRTPAAVSARGGASTLTPSMGSLLLVGTPVATVESRAPTSFVPSGGTFATTLQVQLRDAGNRGVPLAGRAIQLSIDSTGSSSDEQASVINSGGTAVTDGSGTATFGALVLTGSGTVRLTATAPAIASVAANAPTRLTTRIQIAPAPVSALAITSAPTSGAVNADLASVSVELRDTGGARVPEAGRVITLSLDPSNSWTGTLSGTTSGTTDVAGRVTISGFRLIGAAPVSGAAAPRLLVSLTGASSASTSAIALVPGRMASVSLLSAPDTLAVDVPASIVAQLRDVAGNATADAPADYRLTFSAGGISHQEGMRHASFSAGQATFTLVPRATGLSLTGPAAVRSFGFYGEQPSCTGCGTPGFTASRPVTPGPARLLAITQQPSTQQLESPIPSAITVVLRDASDNPARSGPAGLGTALSGQAVTLAVATSLTPGRTLESVSEQPGDRTVLTDASGTATFPGNTLYLAGTAGSVRLIASGANPLTGVAGPSITATPGAAVALQWVVAPPARGRIGAGLAAMSVRVIDEAGNVVPSPARLITLEPVEAGYTLTGGSANTSSGVATFASLLVSGSRGALTLRATATGLTSAVAPAAIDLSSGAASSIALVRALPTTLSVDAAVSGSQSLQVQLVDAGGFAVYEAGRTLTLNLPGTSAIVAGSVATTNATGLADFGATRVRGAAPSTLVGGTVTDAGGLPALSLASLNLDVGIPTQFTLLAPVPTTVAPGLALSPVVRAQLRDVSGNATPVAGRELRFFAQDGSAGDGYPGTALVAVNTDASGIATFAPTIPNLWLPAVGQTTGAQVRAVDGSGGSTGWPGFTQTTGFTLTVVPGAAAQVGIVSAPATVTVDSPFGSSATDSVVAQIRDADGNAVAASGRVATLTLADGATGALSGAALTATSNASGRFVFALSGRRYVGLSGSRSWTVSVASGTPSLTAGTRSVTVSPGAAVSLAVTTAPSDTAALGLALARQPVVEFRDAGGNRATGVNGVLVTLFDGEASVGLNLAGTTASSSNGVATFTSLALTAPLATYRLSATATPGGTPLFVQLPPIVLGVGPATQITFVSGFRLPDQLAIGASGLGETRIQLRDAGGNAAPQGGVSVSATLIQGPGGTLGGSTTRATTGTGTALFTDLTLTGLPGNHVIEFSTSTFSVRDTVIIPVGLMDASQSTLSASPTSISASDASSPSLTTITLTAKDNTGTNRPGQIVRIALSGTASSGATAVGGLSGTTNGSGAATFSVRSTRAGTLTITGFNDATAQQMTQTTSVTVTNGTAAADSTLLALSRSSIAPTGTDTALATITVRDRFLNPVAGATVALTATPSTGLTLQTGGVTNAQGQTFLAIRGTSEITTTIGVTVNGQTATGRTAPLTVASAGPGGVSGGLQTWLRADTGVVVGSGSTVTSWGWRGISATSASGVSAPTWSATGLNGRPAVLFSGTQGLLVPAVSLGNYTVFTVFRNAGTGAAEGTIVWDHGPGATDIVAGAALTTYPTAASVARTIFTQGGGNMSSRDLATGWSGGNTARLTSVRFGGTHATHIIRVDGAAPTGTSVHTTNPTNSVVSRDFYLGHRNSTTTFAGTARLIGAISEVVVFNRALSDAEVTAVETELIARWGLSLPTASFTATAGSGTTMNFDASASTSVVGISSYAWDFGDLSTGSGVTTSRTYSTAGNYTAVLTVTDVLGRTATAPRLLTVGAGIRSTNLLLWARTDLGATTTNGRITRLQDLSANGRDLVVSLAGPGGTANQGPTPVTINGRQGARFMPSDRATLSTTVPLGGTTTMFVAMRPRTTSGNPSILSHGAYGTADGGNGLGIQQGVTYSAGYTRAGASTVWERNIAWVPVIDQIQIRTFQMNGSQASMLAWLNGVSAGTSNPYVGVGSNVSVLTAPLTVASYAGTSAWSFSEMDVMEVLVYDAAVSTTERQTIEQMLASRWGASVTNQLPTVSINAPSPSAPAAGVATTVSATVADPDGWVTAYAWTLGDGRTLATPGTISTSWSTAGVYDITLTVTDNSGGTASATRQIAVGMPTTGLLYWLSADEGLTVSNDTLVTWQPNALSAFSGTASNGTVSARPMRVNRGAGVKPVVRFDGINDLLATPGITLPGTAFTVITLYRPILLGSGTIGSQGAVYEWGGNPNGDTYGLWQWLTSTDMRTVSLTTRSNASAQTSNLSATNVPTGWRLTSHSYAGTAGSQALRVNGAAYATTASGSGTPGVAGVGQSFFVGGRWNEAGVPAWHTNMELAELLFFNRALTPTEQGTWEAQLLKKWNTEAPEPTFDWTLSGRTASFSSSVVAKNGTTIASYAWDYGDLTTGTGATSARTYSADGTYQVQLSVTDATGRTGSITRPVVINTQIGTAFPSNGLYAWFRADSGLVVNGSNHVTEWQDVSGNARHAQIGGAGTVSSNISRLTAPTPNRPVVLFTSSNLGLWFPGGVLPSGYTVLVAANPSFFDFTGFQAIVSSHASLSGTQNGPFFLQGTLNGAATATAYAYNASSFISRTAPSSMVGGVFQTLGSVYDDATGQLRAGRLGVWSSAATQTPGQRASTRGAIGCEMQSTRTCNGNSIFRGQIGEVLIWDRPLSVAERDAAEAYLMSRWGPNSVAFTTTPTASVPAGTDRPLRTMEVEVRRADGSAWTGASVPVTLAVATGPGGTTLGGTTTVMTNPVTGRATFTGVTLTTTQGGTVNLVARGPGGVASANSAISVASIDATGLQAWYAADYFLMATGGNVTQWTDLSGNARHLMPTTQTAATRVDNGQAGMPVVRVAAGQNLATTGAVNLANGSTVSTIFVVFRPQATQTQFSLLLSWSAGNNGGQNYAVQTTNTTTGYNLTYRSTASLWEGTPAITASSSAFQVSTFQRQASGGSQAWLNGSSAGTFSGQQTTLVNAPDRLWLGSWGGTQQWLGDVAEVMVYNRVLNSTERGTVETYLRTKWATP